MTHSNHRRGDRESLLNDWIIFTTDPRHIDSEKHKKLLKIFSKHNPVGLSTRKIEPTKTTRYRYVEGWDKNKDSGVFVSSTIEEIRALNNIKWSSGVYTSFDDVKGVLKDLKKADLGISVVISGLFDEVHESCMDLCDGPHTVNMSAETFGNLDLLPEEDILEITTMCGHHMVSQYLVKHLANQVKKGRMQAEEASIEMAKQCTCNFFNVKRAIHLLNQYVNK
jgi:hypothetical protein